MQYPAVELRTSPHIRSAVTTETIMRNVVYALAPVSLFGIYAFGLSALLLMMTATVSCLLTEQAICMVSGKRSTLGDYSAAITGLLLGLTLPPGFPLWMAALGGVVSIVIGKAVFGGLGFNLFNPALVGRAFLQAAFPVAITTWVPDNIPGRFASFIPSTLTLPFLQPNWDAVKAYASNIDGWTGATPLMLMKFEGKTSAVGELFAGMTAGSMGETSAILILLAGVYLAARRMLDWRIPAGVLASVFVFSGLFYLAGITKATPFFMLCSGGLMLGAVFMATDMVTSPVTRWGAWIFAAFIGFLTVLIRVKGGMPEGMMYAILLGNAVTPIINAVTQPRIYGAVKPKGS